MSCAASLPEHHSENWRLVDRMWTQGPYLSRLLYVVTSWLSNELILNYKKNVIYQGSQTSKWKLSDAVHTTRVIKHPDVRNITTISSIVSSDTVLTEMNNSHDRYLFYLQIVFCHHCFTLLTQTFLHIHLSIIYKTRHYRRERHGKKNYWCSGVKLELQKVSTGTH